ncbi:MAG: YbhB/YbcL family Raf kinase inhibitor-like protein [Acidobacteriota bacterium]|jgi:hypothetical protein
MRRLSRLFTVTLVAGVVIGATAMATGASAATEEAMTDGDLTLTSAAFAGGERIPQVHAYRPEGENRVPELSWTGVPAGTKELALIVDDPDAPREDPWVHWVVYAIPADATGIPAGSAGDRVEGRNDFGGTGWGGPLPPRGHGTHHYHFKLYALDAEVGLGAGATKTEVLEAIDGHVLAQAELVGTYSR